MLIPLSVFQNEIEPFFLISILNLFNDFFIVKKITFFSDFYDKILKNSKKYFKLEIQKKGSISLLGTL